jgi:uncharacterized damage-inducible protein DinB
MSGIPLDQFRRLFEYEQDAHKQIFDSPRGAESEHHDDADVTKAVDLAAHIATCREMWLRRIRCHSTLPPPLLPSGVKINEVECEFARIEAQWRDYLDTLNDAELARECEYVSNEGGVFRNSVHDILVQLFGHSLYHRGQIALLVRRSGGIPAATDFVLWSRRSLAEQQSHDPAWSRRPSRCT